MDKRDKLKTNPFDYRVSKDGKVRISYEGRVIKILSTKDSERLLMKMSGQDDFGIQLALAKVTGNFKRGNERKK